MKILETITSIVSIVFGLLLVCAIGYVIIGLLAMLGILLAAWIL